MLTKNRKGQSLVEFALILPILLMLLLGIIEGARIIWAYITVQNAAREAARYAVTGRPFFCLSTDPAGAPDDPASYCDDQVKGEPWSTQVPTSTRVTAIITEAVKYGRALNVNTWAIQDLSQFNDYRTEPDAFGVAVIGQDADNVTGLPNYGGKPGWNVRVETYYNVKMVDPIYDTIMGGQVIHLAGVVELQNEGIDPGTTGKYVGGVQITSDNCAPNCGSSSVPYITVQDEKSDLAEPAGGHFTVSVNDHKPNTAYKLLFANAACATLPQSSLSFTTDNLGGALLDFVISASACVSPVGTKDYQIYTTLVGGGTAPVATCKGDTLTNAPCFQVTMGNSSIEARNLNTTLDDGSVQKQEPLTIARWPISSSIPIYLFNHDINQSYNLKFNNVGPAGKLRYNGASVNSIPTGANGTNQPTPAYYVATGYAAGSKLAITSEDMGGTRVASTTLDLVQAGIEILGETPTSLHPNGDILFITLRDLAPRQKYKFYVEDGNTGPAIIAADDNGEVAMSYVVPNGTTTASPPSGVSGYIPPKLVDMYIFDQDRGDNPNKIAVRTIQLWTPIGPYLNVPGGARWPAGNPIQIQVRQHQPSTAYRLYLQRGPASAPTFSEWINNATFTTDNNNGNGEYNMYYTIPYSYSGSFTIRSFLPSNLSAAVASYDIQVTSSPYITIDNGKRWPPGAKITIRLQNHVALPHEVWLDRNGPYKTYIGTVNVQPNGEGTIKYTIPLTLPQNISPGYLIASYIGTNQIAYTYLEVSPTDLAVTKIDMPNVTFDVESPITITVRNLSAVTITNTYFDNDIYLDPNPLKLPNPATDQGLPPGDYKTWLYNVPALGSVTFTDTIVLYGQQSHVIYARTDTTNWVVETDEVNNNIMTKNIDAACPVEISEEFTGDGLADWTQTDFGSSGPSCPTLADLPPVAAKATQVLSIPWASTSLEGFSAVYDPFGTSGLTTGSSVALTTVSNGSPSANALMAQIKGRQNSAAVSLGATRTFNTTKPEVTISFRYLLNLYRLDSNELVEYYAYIDGVPIDGGAGTGWLLQWPGDGTNGNQYRPNNITAAWPAVAQTLTLAPGAHTLTFGLKAYSNDGKDAISNDKVNGNTVVEWAAAYMDTLSIMESGVVTPPADPSGTLWSAHYNADAESFTFSKDIFNTISLAGDPVGNHVTDNGAWVDGALYTKLGSTAGATAKESNGGWSRPFTVPAGGGCVTVQGYYRLKTTGLDSSASELARVLIAVDDGAANTPLSGDATGTGDSDWVPFNKTFRLTEGVHTLLLGGYNNKADAGEIAEIWFDDVYVVNSAMGAATSDQAEAANTLILTNTGATGYSTVLAADDNGASAGYHLMHRPVGSGPYEVYVRLDQPPANGSIGLAGLEIRADETKGNSAKLMLAYRSDGRLSLFTRDGGAGFETYSQVGVAKPVWLKILRDGTKFYIYYKASSSDTPPTSWTSWTNATITTMPDSMQVGLFNAPGSSSAYNAKFKHFHLCAASAPGGSSSGQGYLGTKCGQVEEDGNKLVVIDAVNAIVNQSPRFNRSWQEVVVSNVLGEPSMSGLQVMPDSGGDFAPGIGPHTTYQANIQSEGFYYVWIAGWGPNTSGDSVHFGLNGAPVGIVDGFPTAAAASGWRQMPGSITLYAGINVFDLWAKEDGARVFKILLTQNSAFTPPPDGMAQSGCTIISAKPVAPLKRTCTPVINKGDFEGAFLDVSNAWPSSGLATFTFAGYNNSNRGILFPISTIRQPTIYQTFNLPTDILTDTTAELTFKRAVDRSGSTHPDDKLYFELRRASDNFTLIGPVLLADGGDTWYDVPPNLTAGITVPDFDPYNNTTSQWLGYQKNIFAGINPLSLMQGGDPLKVYIYSPKGTVEGSSYFYADNLSLKICTTQPAPVQKAGLGKITGKTLKNGTSLTGVTVWAYADASADGTPGPVYKTESIDDGTYRFYNLPPGNYLIYAQLVLGGADGTVSAQTRVVVYQDTETGNIILNIQTG